MRPRTRRNPASDAGVISLPFCYSLDIPVIVLRIAGGPLLEQQLVPACERTYSREESVIPRASDAVVSESSANC